MLPWGELKHPGVIVVGYEEVAAGIEGQGAGLPDQ